MHFSQPSSLQPVPDRPPADAQLEQLPPDNDPVLAVGEFGNQGIWPPRVRLGPTMGLKYHLIVHGPIIAGRKRPGTTPT